MDMDVKYEYICVNDYNPNGTEYFSLKKEALSYAKDNDEISAVIKVEYKPEYDETIIWERDEQDE